MVGHLRFVMIRIFAFMLFFSFLPIHTQASEAKNHPLYQMDVTYHPNQDLVTGHMVLTLPVTSTDSLKEIYFHLYPNVFQKWKYGDESKPTKPGNIQVSDVRANGTSVKESVKDTIMKVPLPKPVSKGQTVKVEMDFRLELPRGGTRLNTFKHTAFLAQWYPMLAVKDQEGWHTDPYTTTGDPFYSQMSDFEITFRLPHGYHVISTAKDSNTKYRSPVVLKQKNVRDFAAVITKDYQVVRGKQGNVEVNLWYLKGMEEVVKELHDAAVSGMKFYSEKFGPYPYEEIDVVLGETGYGIAGMEYPGLVTSIPLIPTDNGEKPAVNVVVHELAHQWWYGVVGNDQVKEPWLDEGLTTFSEFFYMQKMMKEDERELLKRAAKRTDEIHQAVGISSAESLYHYPESIYGMMVYIRPAAMMYDLIEQVGEEKVVEILRTYYQQYRFHTATTQDFIRTANEVTKKDLTPFFEKWLYFKGKSVT
ncbi:M1 family metallopeptidase [Thermoflavimicrobium dichotomicum]|uniref:Peptidase family M1 n=1 Tax=Thermoflavimicrobium dichotomicum TaxID=46223 RepID=A0A1I3NH36_9BACL|nr:M1 family metallopeptidase [Thermoflavimicrobium dichotomicum]SFJ08280.1 Peptidase family M1 [Thermoflavimicrobium dichotomicum]